MFVCLTIKLFFGNPAVRAIAAYKQCAYERGDGLVRVNPRLAKAVLSCRTR